MGLEGARRYFAWHETEARLVAYDAAAGSYEADVSSLALEGEYRIATPQWRGGLSPRVRALRRALPQLSAGSRRGDVLDSALTSSKRPPG